MGGISWDVNDVRPDGESSTDSGETHLVMKFNSSYLYAAGIFVAVVLLFTVGTALRSDAVIQSDDASDSHPLFEVVTRTVAASPRPAELRLRGRTETIRAVTVRAETGGRVVEAPILEGSPVSAGDVVCRLIYHRITESAHEAEAAALPITLECAFAIVGFCIVHGLRTIDNIETSRRHLRARSHLVVLRLNLSLKARFSWPIVSWNGVVWRALENG